MNLFQLRELLESSVPVWVYLVFLISSFTGVCILFWVKR